MFTGQNVIISSKKSAEFDPDGWTLIIKIKENSPDGVGKTASLVKMPNDVDTCGANSKI